MIVDLYSRLMNIKDVLKYLNKKTDMEFDDMDAVIDFIKESEIPIVFEYEGWGTWNFRNKSEYQSLNIKLKGYFNIQYDIDAINLFTGSLSSITLGEARIYRLDSHYINAMELDRVRSNPLDGLEPKNGDHILFETGGRAPMFAYRNFIDVYNSKANIFKVDSSKSKGKVGLLKVDLEEYLRKKKIEAMEKETKMEALESKIEKLEFENANLRKQLEEAKANQLDKLITPKDSAYLLIAVLKDLLLDPNTNAYSFKTDNNNSTNQPTQAELALHIELENKDIRGLKTRNVTGIFSKANSLLSDARKT